MNSNLAPPLRLRGSLRTQIVAQIAIALSMGVMLPSAHAAYNCNISLVPLFVFYTSSPSSNFDQTGSLILSCTRDASDSNSLAYQIEADYGVNSTGGTNRRVKLGTFLSYSIRRATSAGGAVSCNNTTNWGLAPTTSRLMIGTLNFGTALIQSATWGYCIRTRGNQGLPASGLYTDAVSVRPIFPGSPSTPSVPQTLNYTVAVGNQCFFTSSPGPINLAYTSFSTTPATGSSNFTMRCTPSLPYTSSVSPASNNILGLNYSAAVTPVSGVGAGNTNLNMQVNVNMPAGQAGTCSIGMCSAVQTHTITITY